MTDFAKHFQRVNVNEELERLGKTCRLCLSDCTVISISLFDKGISPNKYSDIVTMLVGLQIKEDDTLPKQICSECASNLILLYRFKQKCAASQCTLSALLVNPSQDVPHQIVSKDQRSKSEQLNPPRAITLDQGSSLFDELLPISARSNSPSKAVYQCSECCSVFAHKASLAQHCKVHEHGKKFTCSLCDQRFTRRSHVKIHMRRHTNDKPFVCKVCLAGFRKSSDLLRHGKVHSEQRNYVCEVCGASFKRSTDVSSHMNSHTGRKPYKCKKCPKEYSAHSSMMKHCRKFNHL